METASTSVNPFSGLRLPTRWGNQLNGNFVIKCQDICLSRQLEGGEPTELAKGNEKRQSQVKTTI